jgi:hypothetical protein
LTGRTKGFTIKKLDMIRTALIVPLLALLSILVLLMHGPIPQDLGYHDFADQRTMFRIPNFLNVVTNLPFIIIGIAGLKIVSATKETKLKVMSNVLFIGFLLLTFGSGYYHLYPNNETLVYDRIPIVIIFMSFFAIIIYDCLNPSKGYIAFIILNIIGILSVIYWIVTEHESHGDLRWYGLVQFFPVIAIPLLLYLYKPTFNYSKEVIRMFVFFGLAKLAEHFDKEIYLILCNTISGHSLKHIFVTIAGYELIALITRRVKPK